MQIQALQAGGYFHIYNRGVNSENIFKEPRNYTYFLKQYAFYCSAVMETLAFALLKNHFHLLVQIKENVEIVRHDGLGTIKLSPSKQLSHFFNSYAQSINKALKRTGPLFESPFERRSVDNDSYITSMIYYCHYNPQLHGFVEDFREWPFTSYHDILADNNNIVSSQKVLDWFGGKAAFEKAHQRRYRKVRIGLLLEK